MNRCREAARVFPLQKWRQLCWCAAIIFALGRPKITEERCAPCLALSISGGVYLPSVSSKRARAVQHTKGDSTRAEKSFFFTCTHRRKLCMCMYMHPCQKQPRKTPKSHRMNEKNKAGSNLLSIRAHISFVPFAALLNWSSFRLEHFNPATSCGINTYHE
jgi:hypothetical protein